MTMLGPVTSGPAVTIRRDTPFHTKDRQPGEPDRNDAGESGTEDGWLGLRVWNVVSMSVSDHIDPDPVTHLSELRKVGQRGRTNRQRFNGQDERKAWSCVSRNVFVDRQGRVSTSAMTRFAVLPKRVHPTRTLLIWSDRRPAAKRPP